MKSKCCGVEMTERNARVKWWPASPSSESMKAYKTMRRRVYTCPKCSRSYMMKMTLVKAEIVE